MGDLKIGAPPFMADERIRRQIAFLAAQMMYARTETEYFTAKRKAAKQLGVEFRHRPGDLPSNREIRDQIQAMARMHEGPARLEHLCDMRVEALRLADIFRAKVVDSTTSSFVFEVTGATAKVDAFISIMEPLGLTDISRTGVVAISRGPK